MTNVTRTTSLRELFGPDPDPSASRTPPQPAAFSELHAVRLAELEQRTAEAAPATSIRELFGYNSANPADLVRPALPSQLAAAPVDAARLEAWEGMFYDPVTGEGIVLQNRDSELAEKKYLHTGWYFERPFQSRPAVGGSLEDRSSLERISPFGFLTEESTRRLMKLLEAFLPPGARIEGIGAGSPNASFPVTQPQREILVSMGGETLRFPAGMLARELCNYTFVDDQGVLRQNSAFSLRNAAASLNRNA